VDGEIIARVERRRQWTPQEKAALLAEVEASGGQVSVVAHGSLLLAVEAITMRPKPTRLMPVSTGVCSVGSTRHLGQGDYR
jgi:hypothetical protein